MPSEECAHSARSTRLWARPWAGLGTWAGGGQPASGSPPCGRGRTPLTLTRHTRTRVTGTVLGPRDTQQTPQSFLLEGLRRGRGDRQQISSTVDMATTLRAGSLM